MAGVPNQQARNPVPPVVGIVVILAGVLCNQWVVGALFAPDGELSHASHRAVLWVFQSLLTVGGILIIWLRPERSLVWSLSRLPLLIIWTLVVLEVSTRALNTLHALERPQHLQDQLSYEWLEGGDWFNGETRLYTYKPNTVGTTYGHPVRVNRWGFRGPDFLPRGDAPDGAFRIMVIGDSTTMGQGVAEQSRYSDVLGVQLRQAYPQKAIDIVNLGIQGHETVQEAKILRRMWPVVRPDLVILGFSINDPSLHYRYHQTYRIPLPEPVDVPLHSLLSFRLFERMSDPFLRRLTHTPSLLDEMWQAYDPLTRDWQLFQLAVTDIATFVRERLGRAPIVICLHEVNDLEQRGAYRQIVETFTRNGFDWIEIPRGKFRPVSRFEPHSDEQTHAEYAKALVSAITRLHVIEEHDAAKRADEHSAP